MTAPGRTIGRLLIANRGEIACRIMRTARAMGIETVAVFSDADRHSPHVALADHAVHIGAAAAAQSYLNIAALVQAIRASGADAVHPGYGFLAENADFARAVEQAGAVWVGPAPEAIECMGNKARAKLLMQQAGVPCIPGYEGADQTEATLIRAAREVGYPIMVKAAAGGGGRGMRLVQDPDRLPDALRRARAEAQSAFGSGELILERALTQARHVEIQIFGDTQGNVIHLGERDCSVQRRHQKLIEEAPCPAVDAALRARMGRMAVLAAQSIHYVGAGTIEWLLVPDGHFYFMEMNTRLQVEHAVTEAITGFDLVAWQLDVAAEKPLPVTQDQVRLEGHAIEVRLTAEDVPAGFLPQTGKIQRWVPSGRVRVDHGLADQMLVSPYYDSMLAKVIAVGATREQAIGRLRLGLRDCALLGIATNQDFLLQCLAHPAFVRGDVDTDFVGRMLAAGELRATEPSARTLVLAAMLAAGLPAGAGAQSNPNERPLLPLDTSVRLTWSQRRWEIALRFGHDGLAARVLPWVLVGEGDQAQAWAAANGNGNGNENERGNEREAASRWVLIEPLPDRLLHAREGQSLWLFDEGLAWAFEIDDPRAGVSQPHASGTLLAPLGGRVASVLVDEGEAVQAGQALVVLEAMKMEHTIVAPFDGYVASMAVQAGAQVRVGAPLATIEPVSA